MPLDAVFLSALTRELAPLIEGSRVDKIRMPERDIVLLGLRTAEGARTLLLCAISPKRSTITLPSSRCSVCC